MIAFFKSQKNIKVDLHDLEGAVGCVEEFDLADAPLWHGVERRAAPAPLQQADGLRCETRDKTGDRSFELNSIFR